MIRRFPGSTVEVLRLEKGSSKTLFDGIFAAGGITLSQVSVMTGLEPYLIQNWVKRGFVSSPVKRLYSREQFARILIINMLREVLQIERICCLIRMLGERRQGEQEPWIRDDELYHRYVDMIAERELYGMDKETVCLAASGAAESLEGAIPEMKKQLERILQVMLYAHAAVYFQSEAEELLSTLQ